jgi:hypothetical protein
MLIASVRRWSGRGLPALALFALAASPVWAGNLLGHRAGYDSIVTFNKSYLTAQFSNAFDANDTDSVEPTDVTTWIWTSDANNDNSGKEVNIYDANYGDVGWYGRWACNIWDGNVCKNAKVQMNQHWSYTWVQARSLMCEEIGHSVSLDHSGENASCMSQQWDKTLLSGHDKGEVNARY